MDRIFEKVADNERITEEEAKELIGCAIYFHKQRQEPSFYGGKIKNYHIENQGQFTGKIAFEFQYNEDCRDIKTDRTGWSKNIKILPKLQSKHN